MVLGNEGILRLGMAVACAAFCAGAAFAQDGGAAVSEEALLIEVVGEFVEGGVIDEGVVPVEGEVVVYDNPESVCGDCEAWTGVPVVLAGAPDPRRNPTASDKDDDVAYRGPQIAPAGNICTTPRAYSWIT